MVIWYALANSHNKMRCFGDCTATSISESFTDKGGCTVTETSEIFVKIGYCVPDDHSSNFDCTVQCSEYTLLESCACICRQIFTIGKFMWGSVLAELSRD